MSTYYIKNIYVTANNDTTNYRSEMAAESKLLELKKEGYDLDEVVVDIEFEEKRGRHSAMTEDLDFAFLACNGNEFLEGYCL